MRDRVAKESHKPASMTLRTPQERVEGLYSAMYDSLAYRLGFLRLPPRRLLVRGRDPHRFQSLAPGCQGACPDVILSILELHAVGDLKGFLEDIWKNLSPGGLFLAVFWGGDSLKELRHAFCEADLAMRGKASPHVFPMLDLKNFAHGLQQTGFEMPVTDVERFYEKEVPQGDIFETLRLLGERNTLRARSPSLFGRNYFEALPPRLDFSGELIYAHGVRASS